MRATRAPSPGGHADNKETRDPATGSIHPTNARLHGGGDHKSMEVRELVRRQPLVTMWVHKRPALERPGKEVFRPRDRQCPGYVRDAGRRSLGRLVSIRNFSDPS